jgi:hypothetical protein
LPRHIFTVCRKFDRHFPGRSIWRTICWACWCNVYRKIRCPFDASYMIFGRYFAAWLTHLNCAIDVFLPCLWRYTPASLTWSLTLRCCPLDTLSQLSWRACWRDLDTIFYINLTRVCRIVDAYLLHILREVDANLKGFLCDFDANLTRLRRLMVFFCRVFHSCLMYGCWTIAEYLTHIWCLFPACFNLSCCLFEACLLQFWCVFALI